MRRGLSDETLDGIVFGLALASNPRIREANRLYHEKLRRDYMMLEAMPRETLAKAITDMKLWTLPGKIEAETTKYMAEAISRVMQGKRRQEWLAALGLGSD